jgi:predicted SnoaL-like aldol condensation-catalyzing enzyme
VTVEENKAIVRRLIEDLWNAGNPELADQLYAAQYVRHGPLAEPPIRSSEALKQFAYMYLL